MRPYEYNAAYGIQHMNALVEAGRKSLGLLCSFHEAPLGASGLQYRFQDLMQSIEELCQSLSVDLHVVGQRQNSLDWMDEVMKVILGSHLVVIDVSHPRPNVLYELGMACSLRDKDSVIICKHTSAVFEASEPLQLQLLTSNSSIACSSKLHAILGSHYSPKP